MVIYKLTAFIIVAVVDISFVGVTLSLMHVVQTNIRNKSKLVLCKPLAYVPL